MFKISRVKKEASFERQNEHYHSFYEFYYLVSGERKIFLNGKNYKVKSGDMMLIPKREIHRTTFYGEGSEHERIAMSFDDEAAKRIIDSIGRQTFEQCFMERQLSIPEEDRGYLEGLFEKILIEYENVDEFSPLLCQMYGEEIVLFVIRCQRKNHGDNASGNRNEVVESISKEDLEMENAAQYMNEHFMEPLTLPMMAEKYCMSDSYFSRRFKQVTGFGFKEYLNMVRIRYACELLIMTDMSVTEISEACGYMDSNYFGDAFCKRIKMSPRQYRKEKKWKI